ncbi:MAG: hypothetical protein Q4E78_05400 [Eubacteriales bacterium]|nr:hypothetical protein [Eubacteriales bacterium]
MKKKKEKPINCFVYLSTKGDIDGAEIREMKQLRYIREYAKAHNIIIKKVYHRDILGQYDVNMHFMKITRHIKNKEADGLLLANIGAISTSIRDAYDKVGIINSVGGEIITVDEGRLRLPIKMIGGLSE